MAIRNGGKGGGKGKCRSKHAWLRLVCSSGKQPSHERIHDQRIPPLTRMRQSRDVATPKQKLAFQSILAYAVNGTRVPVTRVHGVNIGTGTAATGRFGR